MPGADKHFHGVQEQRLAAQSDERLRYKCPLLWDQE